MTFSQINKLYFSILYDKYLEQKNGAQKTSMHLLGPDELSQVGENRVVSTAIAGEDLLKFYSEVKFSKIKNDDEYLVHAIEALIWQMPLQAGAGTTVDRTSYLAGRKHTEESEIKIGSKGTDLFIDNDVSIAEAMILRSIEAMREKKFAGVIFQDVVGPETQNVMDEIWKKRLELAEKFNVTRTSQKLEQQYLPNIDEKGESTEKFKSPGGHAFFFASALMAAIKPELRPKSEGKPVIAVMNNGEDVNGHPEPHIVGYMIKHKIPLALVTTERTRTDVKGGIIVLGIDKDGIVTENLFEVALARTKEQKDLFSKMGIEIRNEGQDARMSNNHVFVNYDALIPQIEKLKKHLNLRSDTEFEREFFKMLVPNLITNAKKKKLPSENQYQSYIQLESSMGDAILNFDSQWRKLFKEPILTCFHFDRFERTKIFTPLKNAFDFLMLYNSDRFTLNKEKMELIDNNPGVLPEISLLDPKTENRFYQNVKNVLDSLKGVSLLDLDTLKISGQVIMKKAILKGKVNIQNESSESFNVDEYFKEKSISNGTYVLEDVSLVISKNGHVLH